MTIDAVSQGGARLELPKELVPGALIMLHELGNLQDCITIGEAALREGKVRVSSDRPGRPGAPNSLPFSFPPPAPAPPPPGLHRAIP